MLYCCCKQGKLSGIALIWALQKANAASKADRVYSKMRCRAAGKLRCKLAIDEGAHVQLSLLVQQHLEVISLP